MAGEELQGILQRVFDAANNALRTTGPGDVAADILTAYRADTSTTAAADLLTVPAGRTWVGTISASVTTNNAAAGTANGSANALFSTAGTGVTPSAGNVFEVDCKAGANAAGGTVGSQGNNFGSTPFVITAPTGNTVSIQAASTITGSAGRVTFHAIGSLV